MWIATVEVVMREVSIRSDVQSNATLRDLTATLRMHQTIRGISERSDLRSLTMYDADHGRLRSPNQFHATSCRQ
jgi:hypothetical protein